MKYIIVIIAVIDGDGNFLLIRRAKDDQGSGTWEFPGGHLDSGESPPVAGLREVREETGLGVFLVPHGITFETPKGPAAFYLGSTGIGTKRVKPPVVLDPEEHSDYQWISSEDLPQVQPTHKNLISNLVRLLKHIHEKFHPETTPVNKSRHASDSETNPTRYMRKLPGPGQELKEAILVGDEVEIFLQRNLIQGETPEPDISGVVEKRNRNTIWVKDQDNDDKKGQPVNWDDRGNWAFLRVYRGSDGVVSYINGNPYDKDSKTVSNAKGLGLILESDPPSRYESVWALMRNETPDLDRTFGQAPQDISNVVPFSTPKAGTPEILHQVREVMRSYGMEPDIVDSMGNNRVLILTQDSDLKRDITRVLKKHGKEIKSTRQGGLLISNPRLAQGTTTIPIDTDEDKMRLTIHQKQREKLRDQKRESAAPMPPMQTTVKPPMSPGALTAPQEMITMPSMDAQIKALEGKVGPLNKINAPGGAKQLMFKNPQQKNKFNMLQMNSNMGKTSSRSPRERLEIQQLASSLKLALRNENFGSARNLMASLIDRGITERVLAKAPLAGRVTWGNFSRYLDSCGEVRNSRIASAAAKLALD